MKKRAFLLATIFLFSAGAAAQDLLDAQQAFRLSARLKSPTVVELKYEIAPGYYMYRDNFRFTLEGASLGTIKYPKAMNKYDPNFQKVMATYRKTIALELPITAQQTQVKLTLVSQGCADVGVCYPPQTQKLTFDTSTVK
jgi:thioredoxin:protein disulfide reductase